MKLGALFGWGIVIYAVVFLTWYALIVRDITYGFVPQIVLFASIAIVTTIAARALRMPAWRDVLPYSIGWVVIAALLDAVVSVPSAGWQMYTDVGVWIGYALIAIVPLIVTSVHLSRGE